MIRKGDFVEFKRKTPTRDVLTKGWVIGVVDAKEHNYTNTYLIIEYCSFKSILTYHSRERDVKLITRPRKGRTMSSITKKDLIENISQNPNDQNRKD